MPVLTFAASGSAAPDTAQYAHHLAGEPVEPVSGKAEDPLRLCVSRTGLWLRCLLRIPGLAGRPGTRATVHREAEDPVRSSRSPVTDPSSARGAGATSRAPGPTRSRAGPGPGTPAPEPPASVTKAAHASAR